MEPFYSRKSPDLVASKTGIRAIVSANSVGGEHAAKDYFSMIENIVDKLATAFEAAKKTEVN
jgi:ABC-type Zn uptake system ZnuABC Zn-binding protein ZnuA